MNWMRHVGAVALLAGLGAVVGCQPRPALPTHEWDDYRDALRRIEHRNAEIENVSSAFDLTIRRPDGGGTATLEGAMVAERPNHVRLQAWRFHREVLDMTRQPDGTWLWTAEQVDELEQQFAHPRSHEVDWFQAIFMTPDPETAQLIEPGNDAEPMVVRWPLGGSDESGGDWMARAEIDRLTLTIRQIDVFDAAGAFVQRVLFSEYRAVDGHVFPMRLGAEGRWNATLRSHDVTLNSELPAGVFDPPSKATRLE